MVERGGGPVGQAEGVGLFEPEAPVEFLGPLDGQVEITKPVEDVGVISEILVPGVLGLVEPFDLSGEVVEPLLVALGEGCTVLVPVL